MSNDIILSGNEETLKPIITAIIALKQMLDGKDIGQFIGQPIEETVRASPHTTRLIITFYSVQNPPWKSIFPGKRLIRATYKVPDVDKRKMTWRNIKAACGGDNGYMWGRFLTTIGLSNGRQIQAYGATEQDAEERARAFLTLSKADLVTISTTEQKKEGRRATDQFLYKEPTRIYPAYFNIINSQRIVKESLKLLNKESNQKRKSTLSGDFMEYGSGKIDLWRSKEPSESKIMIQRALRPLTDDD
ncbi:hypothetical protein NIES4103_31240 [Nostoc sp. NIES-4103]|nr:hypothetical protein NIES4103_31240 [Nostoc sp. NIES-4103]